MGFTVDGVAIYVMLHELLKYEIPGAIFVLRVLTVINGLYVGYNIGAHTKKKQVLCIKA